MKSTPDAESQSSLCAGRSWVNGFVFARFGFGDGPEVDVEAV
jgi:hypothetical protein